MNKEQIKGKALKLANLFIEKSIFDMNDKELKKARRKGKARAIILVDSILNELNELWGIFDKESMHGSQNTVLTKIRKWQKVSKAISEL